MKVFYRCSWQKSPTTAQVDHKTYGRRFGDPRDQCTINKCLNTGGARGIGSYQLDSESLCNSKKGWRGTGWRQGGKEGGDKGETTVVYKYARRNLSQGFVLLHNREYNQWRGLREKTRTECVEKRTWKPPIEGFSLTWPWEFFWTFQYFFLRHRRFTARAQKKWRSWGACDKDGS